MSELTVVVCDQCQAETRDEYSKGWVILEGHITLSYGRDKTGGADTNWLGLEAKWHFCSLECLVQRLRAREKTK